MSCIQYNVWTNYSLYDLKYYFKKNRKVYLLLLFFFFVGLFIGVLISISSDSHLSLLTTKDKVFFDYVNGKVDFSKESMKLMLNFFVFQLIIFLLNLNFYSGLLSYVLVAYQTTLMYLSMVAIVSQFGFSGVIKILILILPTNLILIASGILFSGFCMTRSYEAWVNKKFSLGFDKKSFWSVILFFVLFGILFSYAINLLFMLVLKRRFFIIF